MRGVLPFALLTLAVLCVVVVRQGAGRVELVRQVHPDKWERSLDWEETAAAKSLFPTAKEIGRDGVELHAWVSSLIATAPKKSPAKPFQQSAKVPVVSSASAAAPSHPPALVAARQAVLRQLPRAVQHHATHFAPRQQQRTAHPVRLPARRPRTSPGSLGHLPGPALSGGRKVEAKAKAWMRKIEQLEMHKYRKQYHAEVHRTPWAGARHYGVAQEKQDASLFFDGLEQ